MKQEIVVQKIYPNRKGKPEYPTVQFGTEIARANNGSLASLFLGGRMTEKRVAFQTMHEDKIKEMGIDEGVILNDVLPEGVEVRLTVTEKLQSAYEELKDNALIGYQAKKNPETDQYLTKDGEYIFRKTELTFGDETDTFVVHNGSTVEEPTVNIATEEIEDLAS